MKNGPAAFELPAETTQASYGNPLFGLPDGSVLAVLANPNPASSNEPDDSPWTEVAAMMNEKADPKAVRLTHALHLLMEPEATALFGSRARGNHRPDSDVNIMVVTTRPPPPHLDVNQLAKQIYGHAVEVEIINITALEFAEIEQYLNTFVTDALLDGVTISAEPASWRSRYAPPHPAPTVMSWQQYQDFLTRWRRWTSAGWA